MENIVNRTYTRIGQLLKQDISQGIYSIGDKLPTEREISEKFGISRTIVREAMVMLEVEKLVEVKKRVRRLCSKNPRINTYGTFRFTRCRSI